MTWTDIFAPFLTVSTCWAWYYIGKRIGSKREFRRIVEHGCWFQTSQSKHSPTLNDFLNQIENGRHWDR